MNYSVNLLQEQRNQIQLNPKRKYEETVKNSDLDSKSATSPVKRSKIAGWHVKLATESPTRSDCDTDLENGYSTVHDIETEECRDSDDTESLPASERTSAYATIDVLEYEIATTSEDDIDDASFCTESSATGSDALYIRTLTNIATHALFDDSTTSSDSDSFQPDSEDSDIDDPELGRADYWECVKCKNKQNNPLYRYCERCYQVRKSHFPPRPKNKRLRQRRRSNRKKPEAVVSTEDRSCSDEYNKSPLKLNTGQNMKRKHEDSAGDSISSSSESDIEEQLSPKRTSPKRRCNRNNSSKFQDCASISKQDLVNKPSEEDSSKLSSSSVEFDYSLNQSTNDKHILGDSNKQQTGMNLQKFLGGQHDSGISSQEVGSSQEFSFSDMKPVMLTRMNAKMLEIVESGSDQELQGTGKNYNNQLKPSPLSATSSNCSEASIESGVSVTTLRQTFSDSDLKFNVETNNKQQQQQPLRPQLSGSSLKDNDDSAICILCVDNEKSAVFVHTTKACSGCCYTCAMKSWKKWKVCPFCREKAKNVIKLYSH